MSPRPGVSSWRVEPHKHCLTLLHPNQHPDYRIKDQQFVGTQEEMLIAKLSVEKDLTLGTMSVHIYAKKVLHRANIQIIG